MTDDTLFIRIKSPPPTNWQVWLWPGNCMHVASPPNPFHRLMQRLVFGFRWEKLK